ncbi:MULTISPECIES: esterase-like activity of phytase family protein [Sphingomonas]|uniref:Phytase-like domain-containing protein n=1 Tax=Sphingomonas adhaesiva TaxID=28212 RepID=A0A2A4I9C5_9SPHN|nr:MULTISPECIES: esterase-like activity of phytase family protein [Sphingomonas]PCG15109.1 hypothetical protein COA07_06050 [Sphingomonas adhaesiva]PZU80318.1 MAG: esterase-like activity of phytase family protein [Sphingomonas sp.]
MRWPIALVAVLALVPPWSGDPRRPMIRGDVTVRAVRYAPPGGWPARVGDLVPVGALSLSADDPAFGGFSALALRDGRALLLSDGGNMVWLRIAGGRIATLGARTLREGPAEGWLRTDRDSESLAVDPATGRMWIGYERANAIWRYAPDLTAQAHHVPPAMTRWPDNTGAESLVRLPDGRFLVIREGRGRREPPGHEALLFAGDPALPGTRVATLRYFPPPGSVPSDAALLPDGDLIVVNRRWHFPLRFAAVLVRVPAAQLRADGVLRGRIIATLGPEVGGENVEGVAVTRERGTTMIWLVTDNDVAFYRRTILAKFRLIE